MASRFGHLALAGMLAGLMGCAFCDNPFDYHYAAYGSRLPRADMVNGRVGSVLDPPSGGVLTTQQIAPGEILDADAYAGEYQESILSDEDEAESLLSPDELLIEPSDAAEFEPVPTPGAEQLDEAFDAINDEFSPTQDD